MLYWRKKTTIRFFFHYFFSTCFISFTNHIWTEAINYETHPSLNTFTITSTHTCIQCIWPYKHTHAHHCHSTGRNSFDLVLVLRNGIHLVVSIFLCFFYASRAKQGPWLWLFFLFSKKKLKTICNKFTSQVPEVARAD